MNLDLDLVANAKAFIEAATNLIGLLENNLNALYRIKDKIKLENEIRHVDALIRVFDELMFFNGVFITEFSPKYVMSLSAVDNLSNTRDEPIALDFEKTLDGFASRFDKHAPHIHGLGSDLITLFRQGISLRRSLVAEYHSHNHKTIPDVKVHAMREELAAVWPLEGRLYKIKKLLSSK